MSTPRATSPRNRQLAAIHAMAKQLGLADEDYRAMLFAVARVDSARALDHVGRQAVAGGNRS